MFSVQGFFADLFRFLFALMTPCAFPPIGDRHFVNLDVVIVSPYEEVRCVSPAPLVLVRECDGKRLTSIILNA